MSKQPGKTVLDDDEQYLVDSLNFIQNKLANLRYNIKEIKACLVVATSGDNVNRIQTLQDQKRKTNELIKLGLEDQKRVLSLYKKIKGSIK